MIQARRGRMRPQTLYNPRVLMNTGRSTLTPFQ